MTMLLASGLVSLLPVAIALACPLMTIVMMRGMHGGGHRGCRRGNHDDAFERSLDDLRRERDELNEQISHRAEEVPQTKQRGALTR